MKTPTRTRSLITLLMILTLALWYPPGVQSAVTGRSADSSLAGTEKILSDSSGTDSYILLSTLWGTAQPLTAGITATGSSSWNFSGSTGTFLTSSGLNTFGGSGHAFASILYPSTNDGAALGDATHNFSDLFLASGGLINFNNGNWVATHSSGILTVSTGDLRVTTAGTNAASAVTVGGTQTLTAKTLTSPTITGPSISGTSAFTGAITTTGAITQTSASATAFESGLNGGTNPVFRLVNSIASQATGISITGRAAAAGVDITVLSSGTNESLVVDAKGSGTILLNGTATGGVYVGDVTNPAFSVIHTTEGTGVSVTSAAAASGVAIAATGGTNESMTLDAKGSGTLLAQGTATGAFLVADATNPALSVVHTTEGTGVKITSAAAASGVAVAAISSGTDENMTLDAKGAGTLTLNGTATGATIIGKGRVTPAVQTITGDGAITIQSGTVLLTKGSAAAITLAAPSSQDGTIIEITSTTDFQHVVTVTGGLWDGTAGSNTTITLAAVAGSGVKLIAFGTDWYVLSNQGTTIAP